MNIEVEKGVPIPEMRTGGIVRWPFGKMEPGDSFVLAKNDRDRCRNAANSYSRTHVGVRFTIQRVDDESWRCWRIA